MCSPRARCRSPRSCSPMTSSGTPRGQPTCRGPARQSRAVCVDGSAAELTGGTLRPEVIDVLANNRRAVVLQLTLAQRGGRPALHDREVIVCELRDGRVVEVWNYPGDLHASDVPASSGEEAGGACPRLPSRRLHAVRDLPRARREGGSRPRGDRAAMTCFRSHPQPSTSTTTTPGAGRSPGSAPAIVAQLSRPGLGTDLTTCRT